MPNTAEERLDVERCDKENQAIPFVLIRTSPAAAIRISKNLRICKLHNAIKFNIKSL